MKSDSVRTSLWLGVLWGLMGRGWMGDRWCGEGREWLGEQWCREGWQWLLDVSLPGRMWES